MLGGGYTNWPKPVKRFLYAALFTSPFLLIGWAVDGQFLAYWITAVVVLITMTFTCNMGHYDFFYDHEDIRDQTMTPAAKFIYRHFINKRVDRTDWRYDAIGMALVGMAATVPVGAGLIAIGYVWEGILFGLSGVLKAWAYRDGLKAPADNNGISFLTKGEWRRGIYAGFIIGCLLVWILWEELS